MLLTAVVETAEAVAATRSRLAKIDALATLLRQLEAAEIPVAVGLLTAGARQGRLGVGWRGLSSLAVEHSVEPTLTIEEVDEALEGLAEASGAGSVAVRGEA